MNLRFDKDISVHTVLIAKDDSVLIGYCKGDTNTIKNPETGGWTKSIVNGVTPEAAPLV